MIGNCPTCGKASVKLVNHHWLDSESRALCKTLVCRPCNVRLVPALFGIAEKHVLPSLEEQARVIRGIASGKINFADTVAMGKRNGRPYTARGVFQGFFRCLRCGWYWVVRYAGMDDMAVAKPIICPSCKSKKWDELRRLS